MRPVAWAGFWVACIATLGVGAEQTAHERPNIIVFFVDDLGWTDLGCFGSDFYETPHIDRLAQRGVRFTNAYAACTVCSPSRAALLTGLYPARLHLTDFIPGHRISNTPLLIPDWTQHLELEQVTIAELLRSSGYRTAHFGKWHLTPRIETGDPNDDGNFPEFYPDRQGFEFNFGGCERGAPASYFWPYGRGKTLEDRKRNNTFRTLPLEDVGEGTYLTDHLALEAVKLIGSFGNEPYFIYFPFYNVHAPLEGPRDLVTKYSAKLVQRPDSIQRNVQYAAMVESVDRAVGKVMAQVEEQGTLERTLVIFTSDNGGLYPQATSNAPLRQGKGSIYEGGVRVPAILTWPGGVPGSRVFEEPVITVDWFSTIAQAAGLDTSCYTSTDGVSLWPIVTGETDTLHREAIYWHYPHYHMLGGVPYSAMRMADWKLIERLDGSPPELYQLREDIHEDHNLAGSNPERTQFMQAKLRAWRTEVGAQMPVRNPRFDPRLPTGRRQGENVRKMAVVRE